MASGIKKKVKDLWRKPYMFYMSKRLKNHSFSLITSDCMGGILSHDLKEQFRSPTVNLIIPDFVSFCEKLEEYLTDDIYESGVDSHNYPVCKVGDIEIIGVHYHSHQELMENWTKRAKRVNFSNIFIITSDRFVSNGNLAERFNKLPYPKVCFTSEENPKYEWMVYLPEFNGEKEVGDTLRYAGVTGVRIFEKHFNFIKWLNNNQ